MHDAQRPALNRGRTLEVHVHGHAARSGQRHSWWVPAQNLMFQPCSLKGILHSVCSSREQTPKMKGIQHPRVTLIAEIKYLKQLSPHNEAHYKIGTLGDIFLLQHSIYSATVFAFGLLTLYLRAENKRESGLEWKMMFPTRWCPPTQVSDRA